VATVVPWQTRLMPPASMSNSAHSSRKPSTIAAAGFCGVEARLNSRTACDVEWYAKKSVNVPPTSTPINQSVLIFILGGLLYKLYIKPCEL
jgi:hypothetical protein